MRNLFYLSLGLITLSCSKSTPSNKYETSVVDSIASDSTIDYNYFFKLKSYLTDDNIDTSQIQIIDYDCSILVYPTTEQIEELKKESTDDDFYVIADDNNWYQSLALETLDSVHINQQVASKQFIRLIGEQKKWTLSIRKKGVPEWNLILFKKSKEPKIVSTISFTLDSAKEYFEIKN